MSEPVIVTLDPEGDPAITVKVKAKPPVIGKGYRDEPRHGEWTLDLLERTLFEFRAAGAWDGAQVELEGGGYRSGGALTCEVLARRGESTMPWGWRPSQGPPPEPKQVDESATSKPTTSSNRIAGLLGHRALHGVLLLVIFALVVTR